MVDAKIFYNDTVPVGITITTDTDYTNATGVFNYKAPDDSTGSWTGSIDQTGRTVTIYLIPDGNMQIGIYEIYVEINYNYQKTYGNSCAPLRLQVCEIQI